MSYNRRTPLLTLRDEFTLEDFSGSLNQAAPPDKVPVTDFLRFQNARTCDDGKSFERRPGTIKLATFTGKRILGAYGINEGEETQLLACLNDDIQLKSGGAWSSVFTPTAQAASPVQIAQHKGLTFIAGYEKPIMIRAGVGLYPGIDAPADALSAVEAASGSEVLADSFPETNVDHLGELRQNAARTLMAQSFKAERSVDVATIKLSLRKVGAPTGNLWVEIHSGTSGTSATKNASTNILGQASDNKDVSTLSNTLASITLNFTGTKPSLTAGNIYFIVVYGDFAVSSSSFVLVGFDSSSPSYLDGRYYELDGSLAWAANDNTDLIFEVSGPLGDPEELVSHGTLTTDSFVPLMSSANVTILSQSFVAPKDCSVTEIELALGVKKPGGVPPVGNLWVEIHSSKVGTSATKGASAWIVGAPSDEVDPSTLPVVPELGTGNFAFSGALPTLLEGVTYYIMLYAAYPIDATKHAVWGQLAGYSDGEGFSINGSMVWSAALAKDFCFRVLGRAEDYKAASYDETHLDTYNGLRETAAQAILAQSFVATFTGTLTKVRLYLSKVGSPTGSLWVEIHKSQAGTSASKNSSTNIVGQATAELDVSTLDAFPTFALKDVSFTGTQPALESGSLYYIVVYGTFSVSQTAFVKIGMDKDSPDASGVAYDISGSLAWTEKTGSALAYYIYRAAGDMAGTYSYLVTFVRGGNYPTESNPGPVSANVSPTAGQSVNLSSIPISGDSNVTARHIYRTEAGGATYKWLCQIADNTTATYTDNASDAALGEAVSYGNSRPPGGSTIEVWDGKLWVGGVPGYEELLFPSGLDTPEQFNLLGFLMLREREAGKILRVMEFENELTAFKGASIWKVERTGDSYVVDKMVEDVGLGAVGSAVRCGKGMLIFLSNHKKIEILTPTGLAQAELPISAKVKETLASINTAALHKCVAGNYVERGEYRLAVPTGTNTEPDTIIVFNYLRGSFSIDYHPYSPTSMNLTDYSLGARALLLGSSAGSLYRVDEAAATDDGVGITMDVQTGWFTTPSKIKIFRTYLDYVLPESSTMSFRVYRNFEGTPSWDKDLTGNTPTGADPTIRNTIRARLGMALQGKAFSFRFVSAGTENVKVSRINAVLIQREKGQGVQAV